MISTSDTDNITINTINLAGIPCSNRRHDEQTMMAWLSSRKSGSGSLHSGKDLTNVSKVALTPAGLPVGYMDPVTRHIRGTPAYEDYNEYVKNLNLPSSVASSPASIGNLTGKKVVMHMHYNSDTYGERVRAQDSCRSE